MKQLLLIFLFFANPIFSQETTFKSINELLNLKEDNDLNVMITDIDPVYHCINQTVHISPDGKRFVKLAYSDGKTIDTLVSCQLLAIDSMNFVELTVGKSNHFEPNEYLYGEYDTLYFKFSEGYSSYSLATYSTQGPVGQEYWIEPTFGYKFLEHGTYDILARFLSSELRSVILENYIFSGPDTLYFDADDAKFEVLLRPVNISGDTIPKSEYLAENLLIMYKYPKGYFSIKHGFGSNYGSRYFFSNYTQNFEMYFSSEYCNPFGENEIYYIDYPTLDSGIVQNITLSNNPDNYISANVDYTMADHDNYQFDHYFGVNSIYKYFYYFNGNYSAHFDGVIVANKIPFVKNWIGKIYLNSAGNPNYTSCPYSVFSTEIDGQDENRYFFTNAYDYSNDSIANFMTFEPYADIKNAAADDTLYSGYGTSIPWLRWKNYFEELNFDGAWYGSSGDLLYPFFNSQLYQIIDENGVVITEGSGCSYYSIIDAGEYTVKFSNNHNNFGDFIGKSEASFHFNTTLQDYRPPTIRPIQFRNENDQVRHKFTFGENIYLYFAAADFYYYSNVFVGQTFHPVNVKFTEVKIKTHQQSVWELIEVESIYNDSLIGNLFKANLSDYITNDSSLYDIQIKIVDSIGNSATYTFLPAFVVAEFPVSVNHEMEPYETFISVFPNPANENLTIKLNTQENADVNLTIYDISGKLCYQKVNLHGNNITINLKDFSPGMYCIILSDRNNSKLAFKKFIVSR